MNERENDCIASLTLESETYNTSLLISKINRRIDSIYGWEETKAQSPSNQHLNNSLNLRKSISRPNTPGIHISKPRYSKNEIIKQSACNKVHLKSIYFNSPLRAKKNSNMLISCLNRIKQNESKFLNLNSTKNAKSQQNHLGKNIIIHSVLPEKFKIKKKEKSLPRIFDRFLAEKATRFFVVDSLLNHVSN